MLSRYLRPSAAALFILYSGLANAQNIAPNARPRQRIFSSDTESSKVSSPGNVHPFIWRAARSEPADPTALLEHLVLPLQATAEQEAELDQLIAQQSDPESANYHKYLTPEEFAARYGAHPADIEAISNWLESHGLRVEEVAAGNRAILFNGTVAQVAHTFETEIRRYTVDGVKHLANATDPKIPAAFAGTVGGVLRLHDFPYHSYSRASSNKTPLSGIAPEFSPLGIRMLAPADYYSIYDINPLLYSGIDGTGQSIAVLARSNIYLTDVQSFRSMFGLKANDPQLIVTKTDPGVAAGFDSVETTMDTEWAGAIAPGATIKVIISASTGASDGIDLSATYAVTKNVAPIITVSYGGCEAQLGATELAFYNSLWKQASAQGQTVLVASGDSGAAGCDNSSSATAKNGKGVNGLCSSPYATCVGGTEFAEGSNPGVYWLPAGPSSVTGSALGYIPESVWNESGTVNSGGGGVAAGGGGASTIYPKPVWQAGPGVPADGKRDVPDVSLTAAAHDAYTVVQGGMLGYIFGVSGTSASTPSFAGMIALVNQQTKSAQGNINATLYSLATKQASGGAAVFHDVKTGDNSVPGQAGFAATTGYDLATGLGSVDANLMATMWLSASVQPPTLSVYGNVMTLNAGQSGSTTVTTIATGIKSAVALSVSGVPSGVTATFTPASIATPGSGSSVLKVVAGANAVPGIYTLKLTATAGTQTAASNFELTITKPTFTLNYFVGLYPSVYFGPDQPFAPQTIKLQTLPSNGFSSPITLSASGLPAGITVAFSPSTLAAGAVGNSVATVSVANTVKGGQYSFTINATGGGVTQSVTYGASVFVRPSCALTPDQMNIAFKAGATAVITLTCPGSTSNTTPVSLSVTGAPGGVTAKLSASTISAGKTATLTLTTTTAVSPGIYALTFTGSEASGAVQNAQVFAAISIPVFSLAVNPSPVKGVIGSTTQFVAQVTPDPGFTTGVHVGIGGLPNGVTAVYSAAPSGSLGNTITLTIDKTATAGSYPIYVQALGNTVFFMRTVVATLTLTAAPQLSLSSSIQAVTLKAGSSAQVTLTTKPTGSFNSPVSLSATGLPSGVGAQFSAATVGAPGNGSATMTLTAGSTAKPGVYTIGASGNGGGTTASASIQLTITH